MIDHEQSEKVMHGPEMPLFVILIFLAFLAIGCLILFAIPLLILYLDSRPPRPPGK
jgi:hypothetical protein